MRQKKLRDIDGFDFFNRVIADNHAMLLRIKRKYYSIKKEPEGFYFRLVDS